MKGVKQVCTISLILFKLYVDPMIGTIESMAGFQWGEKDEDQVSILGYANCVALESGEKRILMMLAFD